MTTEDLQTLYNYKYVIYDTETGARLMVMCRKCNEKIADMVDGAFRGLTNYTKVQYLLSPNLEMNSAMCKKCAKHLSKNEMVNLYKSEIQAIEWDGEVHGKSTQLAPLITDLLGRTVVRRIN